jgi:hypothetical protein
MMGHGNLVYAREAVTMGDKSPKNKEKKKPKKDKKAAAAAKK